jgi:hypothetical protein
MKKLLLATLIALAITGCGGGTDSKQNTLPSTSTITSEPVVLTPQPIPVVQEPPKPLVTPTPTAQTGSVYLEAEPVLLAQANWPMIVEQKILGTNTENYISLEIKEPPVEISPCYGAVITYNVPPISKEYQYNGWWLLATLNNLKMPTESPYATNFYWATQISETQVGAVPTGYVTNIITDPPLDVKLDLGYTILPYQWVPRAGIYSVFPVNPDEKCVG